MTKKVCWKDAFDTLKKARNHAKNASKKLKKPFHAYLCENCGKYHISKFSKKQANDFKKGLKNLK